MDKAVHKRFLRPDDTTTPPPAEGNGGSFGLYFREKKRKLHHQFSRQQQNQNQGSGLFTGVSIHVNGHTIPSHQELRQLMAVHGGTFVTYYNRSQVTHFICNNIPDARLKQMQHERNPVPVVRSEWIVASIQAGRLLPIKDFLLESVRDAPGQRTLLGFQVRKAENLLPAEKYPILAGTGDGMPALNPNRQEDNVENDQPGVQADLETNDKAESSEDAPVPSYQLTQMNPDCIREETASQASLDSKEDLPLFEMEPGNGFMEQEYPIEMEDSVDNPGGVCQPQLGGQNGDETESRCQVDKEDPSWAEARMVAAEKRSACSVLKGPVQSSKSGPAFMETYFKSSRLHFIGTWQARIESLAATMIKTAPMPVKDGSCEQVIVHLDMDCFFASASAVGKPVLRGKPLVVCHSNSANGTGEISAANYEARVFGIRAGSRISKAKELCPGLIVVPYEFDKYQDISEKVYRIAMTFTGSVQPISCDEAYLDITGLGDPVEMVSAIRAKIYKETECTVSAGIAPNPLLARMATKKAKPNGQFQVLPTNALNFISGLPVGDLPGVGRSLGRKLASMGVEKVGDIFNHSKKTLQIALGQKTGELLFQHAQGQDDRQVEPPKPRKSIGADCNWGIRFSGVPEAMQFLQQMSQEVSNRLKFAGVRGRTITLKVKRRRIGAPEPSKFLGCGICDSLSRSMTLSGFTNCEKEIYSTTKSMFSGLGIPPVEIRGVGITVSKFDNDASSAKAKVTLGAAPAKAKAPPANHVFDKNKPHPWLSSESVKDSKTAEGKNSIKRIFESARSAKATDNLPEAPKKQNAKKRTSTLDWCLVPIGPKNTAQASNEAKEEPQPTKKLEAASPTIVALPPASQIDPEVWDALPPITRRELEHEYEAQELRKKGISLPKKRKQAKKVTFAPRKSRKKRKTGGNKNGSVVNYLTGAWSDVTYSQLDMGVVAELPVDIRKEVVTVAKSTSFFNKAASRKVQHSIGPNSGKFPGRQASRAAKEYKKKELYTEASLITPRLNEVEERVRATELPSDFLDLQKELFDWMKDLDPMTDAITHAIRYIKALGEKVEAFLEPSLSIVKSVLEYIEEKHGLIINYGQYNRWTT